MNDELSSGPAAAAAAGPDTVPQGAEGPATAGGLIRAARQAQGLDLASLAAMLKIPLRKLDALEQGRHEELQGPTFERALAQAACRVLKVDPKPVLALMPQYERNTLERVAEGLNTPFRERQGAASFDLSTVMRPVVILPVLIVLAALALFYVPTGLWSRIVHPVEAGVGTAATSASGAAISAPAPAPVASEAAVVAADPASLPAADLPESPASAVAEASAIPVAATPSAAVVDEVLAHSEAPPSIPLQVIASADSWVEVVDAQGHPLLSRTVVAGESVGLDGALPMRVKIGNARATRLTLRGDNVDLAPWTRDNVARVELK